MNEIILYQPNNVAERIEVRLEDETVWLNRQQIAILFKRDVKTIGKHINNALREELKVAETTENSVVAIFATTAKDGKTYQVEYYNLDVILSVGYRVKSEQGIQFRIWANKILKDHLLKGYSINRRIDRIEDKYDDLSAEVKDIRFQLNTTLPKNQGIFFDGQIFDAYVFVCDLIKSAQKDIVLIDNYIDESVLQLLTKRAADVEVRIYTAKKDKVLQQDLKKYKAQYGKMDIKTFAKSHDRFLIIDEQVYHFGASLKDLGKKWFAFSKMEIGKEEILSRL